MRTATHVGLQIVAWPEDRKCDRDWLLEKIAGATGAIVMLSDKVWIVFIPLVQNGR
jgi:glyoxylate/hydroxypyruvate reductase